MATSLKIRLLLVVLCAGLFFTALTVQNVYNSVNSLAQSAKILEENLHSKEAKIFSLINNKGNFQKFKDLPNRPQTGLGLIQYFTTNNSIWFITTRNGHLDFWSGVKIIPDTPALIKEGVSFIKKDNGYFEAVKKSEGNFSVIFFVPVRQNFSFQNQYLQNTFSKDLLPDTNVVLTNDSTGHFRKITSLNHRFLFSIKLKSDDINSRFLNYEFFCWFLCILSCCILLNSICNYVVSKGYVILALLILSVIIIAFRFAVLQYNWLIFVYKLEFFKPDLFSAGFLNRSFGDFCINILLLAWFVSFLYYHRKSLLKTTPNRFISYVIYLLGIITLLYTSNLLLNMFYSLVIKSKINFDVTNVLNLTNFSYAGLLMLCFSFLIFYLLNEVFLTISLQLPIKNFIKAALFIVSIIVTTAILAYNNAFTLFYILWACIVFIRAYAFIYKNAKLDSVWFAVILLICSLISSIKLNAFEMAKEGEARKLFLKKLEVHDDGNAVSIFRKIEKQIIADSTILGYFQDQDHSSGYLKTRIQKLFFSGYLSRYELIVEAFDPGNNLISAEKSYSFNVINEMVLYSSTKVSQYFYKENESFGVQSYYAILPVSYNGKNYGTIMMMLKLKPMQFTPSFPGLLIDGSVKPDNEFKDYSYAFYIDNKLLSQNGDYVYDLTNSNLKGIPNTYVYKTTRIKSSKWYLGNSTFSHLIYQSSLRNVIIVSKEENPFLFGITSTTFFFVIFLVFSLTIILMRWLWSSVKVYNFKNNSMGLGFNLSLGLLLYKTRIQLSMVAAVVITLVIVGVITFLSISTAYQNQQEKIIRDKIDKISIAIENSTYSKFLLNINEESQLNFIDFANAYSADITLFDLNGEELITTEPRIYEFGLQAPRINAKALINLSQLQRSEFVNDETIGNLNYKSVYRPLRDSRNKTFAYLQLPYFSNEADYKEQIGSLINIMFNVYAVVFIAIGFFAVVIARQITYPLNFIQQSISNTIYGKKNEPIKWERRDEIGALVAEYNKMIAELENSAQRLAQSERESAWREMAKQVAHEIKNPLTPLKLGLQLLDKSWRDKDPKFDQKFERFNKSFVEQIESLSSIASEFSAFAKMPDTRLERINIFEVLNQAVIIFKQTDNVEIIYNLPDSPFKVNADRDQLLRCFNNLLKNAIEAFPSERDGLIEINYVITGTNILLTIKDNGNGIPENLRKRIFEPSFTTKSSGTGLGLAFVKNSIENAGGKIWFETDINEGTTFFISLPAIV